MRRALVLAMVLVSPLWLPRAAAQCPLLDPGGTGANGQTRQANFLALVEGLYTPSPVSGQVATKRIRVGGLDLQAPPWFESSTQCTAAVLNKGGGRLPSPSFADYLVVSDELSELAVVTALAGSDSRMMDLHRTAGAMESATHPGLPCWLARATQVQGGDYTLDCVSEDTASDATARFGLAYYLAAANPSFPAASRQLYRAAADALAARHLAVEYAGPACFASGVTGHTLCRWISGGGDTAAAGLAGSKMWIGYHQDVVLFLLAAAHATGDSTYLTRAEEVVDQWLMASTFNGTQATFGRFNFQWNTAVSPIAPKPGDTYWWQGVRAWDDADAPRALWMGDALRAITLVSGGAPLPAAYQSLSAWVQAVLARGHQTATSSCIQYNQDGTVVSGNCGTDYYYNGLGSGLLTFHNTGWLASKLDTALAQYGWTGSKTWNNSPCFGIYRGVRPVKALAAAIGLDTAAYGSCTGSPLPAPSWLAATPVTASRIDLAWVDNAASEQGFNVERKQGCCGTWTALPNAPANATTYQSTGLACGTSYAYRVRAFNAAGSSAFSNEASASTLACPLSPPTAPSWLRVTAVSGSRIDLRWDDPSSNEDGFAIERKQGCCGPWTALPNAPANATTYQSTGLACGTSYAYRVRAFNAAGSSAPANEAATSTLACP